MTWNIKNSWHNFFIHSLPMERLDDKHSGLKSSRIDAIEVRFGKPLLRSRKNLGNILSSYSLDNGPFGYHESGTSRISFRFSLYDWDRTLKHILSSDYVPFEISTAFSIDLNARPRKKKVCLGESDLNTLFALNVAFENAGYDVWLSHCSGPMMEAILPATDAFVLDDARPAIDAIEICRHLRKQSLTHDTPVIVMSTGKKADVRRLTQGLLTVC